jgi:hypothetical protein
MQEQELREVSSSEARAFLRKHAQPAPADAAFDQHIEALLELLITESGLLQDRAGKYAFAHYTLQEYLAARAVDLQLDDNAAFGVPFLFERRGRERWRETILLAIGHWVGRIGSKPRQAQHLIEQLLATQDAADLFLAASALVDALKVDDLQMLREQTAARLRTISFDPSHCSNASTRNHAATLLDQLGADADRAGLLRENASYWARRIEPGPFKMGDG